MTLDVVVQAESPDTSVWLAEHGAPPFARQQAEPASAQFPSAWLLSLWTAATQANREALWQSLPDRLGDHAEKNRIELADVRFLVNRSADRDAPWLVASVALRALARICEDDPRHLHYATVAFETALRSDQVGIRAMAAEAIWQARALRVLPALEAAAGVETDAATRETMLHVRRVLR